MSALPAAIGRYEVQAFIARGGMGTLYLASDPVLQRQVAIKLLREADNEELRARFTREARSAANLRHRNIVTIFDVGDHQGQPFMAMEYIQGQTLTSIIESDPPPSIIRRLQLVEDLCDGLAYAHRRGVIHRDIKPANLMLDAEGTLKILDFGIARAAAEAGMTQAGLLIGTLNYMSPEQVAGGELDGRSDMFAVGAVLYELLARRQAFPGSIDGGVLNRILNGEPEPLETLCPHLDPAIYQVVRRALAKAPADRYPDLQQMRTELSQARQKLEASALGDFEATYTAVPQAEPTMPGARTPRRGTDREELVRRRAQQIDEHLTAARQALTDGDPDAAIAACEQALLLDPHDGRAFDLAERARLQRDERQAQELLSRARESFKRNDLTLASSLVREALSIAPDSSDAIELGRLVGEARLAQERERQRESAVQALVGRARAALERGALDEAASAVREALSTAPGHPDAQQLDDQVTQAVAARERDARDADARETAAEARRLFAAGQQADALALLEDFLPAHPVVSQTWTELSAEAARQAEEAEAAALASTLPPHASEATVFAPRPEPSPDATVFVPRSERQGAAATPMPLPPANAGPSPRREELRAPAGQPLRPHGPAAGRREDAPRSRTALYVAAAVVLALMSLGAYLLQPGSPAPTDTAMFAPTPDNETGGGADAPFGPGEPETATPDDADPRAATPEDAPPAATTTIPAGSDRRPTPEPPSQRPVDRETRTVTQLPTPPRPPDPPDPAPPPGRPIAEPDPPPAPPATTSIPPRPEPAPEPERSPAPEPVREVPPQATTTVPPAPPSPPSDRQLIEATLTALARGYNRLDAAAVAAVFPSVDRRTLQGSFDDTRELEMRVDIRGVKVDGDRAVVQAVVHQRFQGRVGSEQRTSRETEFRMRRSGAGWIVESRR